MENGSRPFGMRDKIGYMFGDFGNDFTFILSSMMLMKFYSLWSYNLTIRLHLSYFS